MKRIFSLVALALLLACFSIAQAASLTSSPNTEQFARPLPDIDPTWIAFANTNAVTVTVPTAANITLGLLSCDDYVAVKKTSAAYGSAGSISPMLIDVRGLTTFSVAPKTTGTNCSIDWYTQ